MSEADVLEIEEVGDPEDRPKAEPIESRFLFVDVAALRAKQLRRGARPRLPVPTEETPAPRSAKAERLAMEEVKDGLVEWQLPEFKVVIDNR
ncbi:MAG: DNA-directed RNA polymerase subunit omega [Acidobacteria bacterium]|nr:DNA-directed RNA polymerase subunit omega [Acidobacteriota bacterium]